MMDMVRSLNMLDGLFMDKMQFLSWLSSCKSVKHTKRYNYFLSKTFTRNALKKNKMLSDLINAKKKHYLLFYFNISITFLAINHVFVGNDLLVITQTVLIETWASLSEFFEVCLLNKKILSPDVIFKLWKYPQNCYFHSVKIILLIILLPTPLQINT